jgi:Flp pilus assembly protein TadG
MNDGIGGHWEMRNFSRKPKLRDERGVVAVVVAVMIVMFLGFAALVIDVGYFFVTGNELQNIADASSLAAARQLGAIYQSLPGAAQATYTCDDPTPIKAAAQDVASKNQAGGKSNIIVNESDIIIGQWDGSSFTPTLNQPDAVRVIARRDQSANGAITTFFAKLLGINSIELSKDAIAALSGQGTTEPGEVEIPVGISSYFYLPGNFCNDYIKFSPTNDPDSCAGWNSFDESPSNDPTIRQIIDGEIESPGTTTDPNNPDAVSSFNYIGGDLSTITFDKLLSRFQLEGYDVDAAGDVITNTSGEPLHDATGTGLEVQLCCDSEGNQLLYPDGTLRNKHMWETTVVVYRWDDCDNPNTSIEIAGYSKVLITDVLGPPDKMIRGQVLCDRFSDGDTRGGGGNYGVKGTIPGLVE